MTNAQTLPGCLCDSSQTVQRLEAMVSDPAGGIALPRFREVGGGACAPPPPPCCGGSWPPLNSWPSPAPAVVYYWLRRADSAVQLGSLAATVSGPAAGPAA